MHIGILSFNKPELTKKCVRSVLANTDATPVHLMHNGSRPEVIGQLKDEFPALHHHILSENKGFTGGTNALLTEMFKQNPWAFFITNDCELLTPPTSPKEIGFYAPKIWRRHSGRVDSLGGVFTPLLKRLRHSRADTRRPFVWPRLQYFYVPGTAFLIHKQVFETVGHFDESLHTYWEDVDFSVRTQRAGHTIDIWPQIELRHAIGKTCHKDKFYTSYLFKRNRDLVSRRYWF